MNNIVDNGSASFTSMYCLKNYYYPLQASHSMKATLLDRGLEFEYELYHFKQATVHRMRCRDNVLGDGVAD